MKQKRKPKLTTIMIANQFHPEHWETYDENLINSAIKGDINPLLTEIVDRVNTITEVSSAYAIIHDKDEETVFDSENKQYLAKKKTLHGHFLLKFKGATLEELALAVHLKEQYLEKGRSGRFSFDSFLAYLIHKKDPSKFQYDPQKVVTLLGTDYMQIFKERADAWERGRALKEAKATNEEIDLLLEKIITEQITKSEILLDVRLQKVYLAHKTRINEAFATLGEIKSNRTKIELENGDFKKSIFFFHGKSGVGKTQLAKQFVTAIESFARRHYKKWNHLLTAGTNALDEFNGEEILLLDDVRGDSLTASDWLKLLDPYTISPISARYSNRMGSARIIIITSTKHPLEFFYKTKGNEREDLSQFIRRFDSLITLDENDFFYSTPKRYQNVRRKLPHSDIDLYLNYDFDKNQSIPKKELIDFLLTLVSLNNRWERE